jgi:hypothetical protein
MTTEEDDINIAAQVIADTMTVADELRREMASCEPAIATLTAQLWHSIPNDTVGTVVLGALIQALLNVTDQYAKAAQGGDESIDHHTYMAVYGGAVAKNIADMAYSNSKKPGVATQ